MQICKYCNESMTGKFETLPNNSYFFFYNCPKCESIYEGKAKGSPTLNRDINSKDILIFKYILAVFLYLIA